MKPALPALWVWAARDVLRRPGEALLVGVAVAALVALLATGLLLTQGLENSAEDALDGAPSLVIRRLGPEGWAPMPTTALERVRNVRGVTRASARVWGVVRWQDMTVTVVADSSDSSDPPAPPAPPPPGEAVVGPAFGLRAGDILTLHGRSERTLRVREALPESAGLVAHDVVLLHEADARSLLGLPAESASDLAVWVFHDEEMDAIRPDLERSLSFPVHITTRRESLGATKAELQRAAGLETLLLAPALLALALLVVAMTRIQWGARRDIGLLKALGWRTAEVLRLHVLRALVIGLPALAVGWGVAYALVFVSGGGWAGTLLFGWSGVPPRLALRPTGALITLLEVGGLVLAPYLAAVLFPALRSATTDPEEWLRGEEL